MFLLVFHMLNSATWSYSVYSVWFCLDVLQTHVYVLSHHFCQNVPLKKVRFWEHYLILTQFSFFQVHKLIFKLLILVFEVLFKTIEFHCRVQSWMNIPTRRSLQCHQISWQLWNRSVGTKVRFFGNFEIKILLTFETSIDRIWN